jgi:hypothetical protein
MFRVIQRSDEPPFAFDATNYEQEDEAVWAARASPKDYLIEEISQTGASLGVIRYRLGKFELG